jgi:hypothetical protein
MVSILVAGPREIRRSSRPSRQRKALLTAASKAK